MVRNPDKLRHVAALAPRQSTEPDAPLSPERYDLNLPALDLPGLRPARMREADADDWHDYLRLEEVTRHTSWRLDGPATLSALIRAYAEPARSSNMRLAIAGPDDRLVGTIGLNEISIPHRRAEIATTWRRRIGAGASPAGLPQAGRVGPAGPGLRPHPGHGARHQPGFAAGAGTLRLPARGAVARLSRVAGASRHFWIYARTWPPASAWLIVADGAGGAGGAGRADGVGVSRRRHHRRIAVAGLPMRRRK